MRKSIAASSYLGLPRPDRTRSSRVPSEGSFRRSGAVLSVSARAVDYRAGDLVTWRLPGNLPHIGIVTVRSSAEGRPLIVHNIGNGPEVEDILFGFPITGHYRYVEWQH